LVIAVLVPNLRGCEAAVEAGAHKISIPLSLSETHSIKNVRRDHAQMLEEIAACQALVDQVPEADRPDFEVGLSTAFGCTIEGAVEESFVIDMAERVLGLGVAEVGLSDTTGMGNPAQLERLVTGIWQRCGESPPHRCAPAQHPGSGSGQCIARRRAGHYHAGQFPRWLGRLPVCARSQR
jgi:hydroxymethylglutaryl-CoA lyase